MHYSQTLLTGSAEVSFDYLMKLLLSQTLLLALANMEDIKIIVNLATNVFKIIPIAYMCVNRYDGSIVIFSKQPNFFSVLHEVADELEHNH